MTVDVAGVGDDVADLRVGAGGPWETGLQQGAAEGGAKRRAEQLSSAINGNSKTR